MNQKPRILTAGQISTRKWIARIVFIIGAIIFLYALGQSVYVAAYPDPGLLLDIFDPVPNYVLAVFLGLGGALGAGALAYSDAIDSQHTITITQSQITELNDRVQTLQQGFNNAQFDIVNLREQLKKVQTDSQPATGESDEPEPQQPVPQNPGQASEK